jgi:ATP-dependent RNA helicase RhlE
MSFSNLGLSPVISSPLARLGYAQPTPIQSAAIPVVLSGVDLLARAQTGTGKTAAFGLPMIERLSAQRAGSARQPKGLVLVPTRELALQVHKSLSTYGAPAKMRAAVLLGGVSMGPQIQALRAGVDIVVATPGRLIDHMQQRTIDLSRVEVLVLDEGDRMLDMGFQPALRRINGALPKTRQTLLFSATLSEEVTRLAKEFTRDPKRVDVSGDQTVATTVTHQVHPVHVDDKRNMLSHVLKEHGEHQALIFCRTKRGANRVGEYLEKNGVRAGVIHGNKSQGARVRALDQFKSGRVRVLVATDIAARGLDIKQLPLVINFDLPLVAEDYVHRIGRTGRAGQAGRAVSLASSADSSLLREIQSLLAEPLEYVSVPGFNAPAVNGHASERHPQAQQRPHSHRPNGRGQHGEFRRRRPRQASFGRRRSFQRSA